MPGKDLQEKMINRHLGHNRINDDGRLGGKRGLRSLNWSPTERELFRILPCNNAEEDAPKAMMVRPVAPVRAVKAEQVIRAMIDNRRATNQQSVGQSNQSSGALLSERRYPAKVRGDGNQDGMVQFDAFMIMAEESILAKNKEEGQA